ncbi:MAG TPA: hypothetical protein VGE77_10660 [Nocardioides sp.]
MAEVDGTAGDAPLPRVRDLARDALGRMLVSVVASAGLVLTLLAVGIRA